MKLSTGHVSMSSGGTTKSDGQAFAAADAPATDASAAVGGGSAKSFTKYLTAVAMMLAGGLGAVWQINRAYAPEMYDRSGPKVMAEALARHQNYAVFDLNINIREMRDEHIARLDYTPDVVILGASHWQEAHANLVRHKRLYNSHVHRDYWEDPLGVVEMFVRHNRLPKQMIIAVRDNQFVSIPERRDHLWLPGIPYYRDMARRLGLEAQSHWSTLPVERWRELLSLPMLHTNVARWYNATSRPHATDATELPDLDILLPGGSIVWSQAHKRLFTPERTERLSVEFAAFKAKNPPTIDPKGVEAFDALLAFLKRRGVEVFLAHPPYNSVFWQNVQGTPYMPAVRKVEQLTRDLADRHGARVIGSFDPADLGCAMSQYIDAEHADPACLGRLLDQYSAIDQSQPAAPPQPEAAIASAPEPKGRRITAMPAVSASAGTPPPPAVAEAPARTKGKARKKRETAHGESRPRKARGVAQASSTPASSAPIGNQ